MEQNKYKLPIIFLVVGLVIGFLVGYYLVGKNFGLQGTSTQELENLVALTFPKPPEDLRTILGTVKKLDGTNIQIEVGDPNDYLPHSDGSPQRTMSRIVKITESTEMYILRPTQIDKNGNISRETIKVADLKINDMITITSNENVRSANEFSAILIEKVEF